MNPTLAVRGYIRTKRGEMRFSCETEPKVLPVRCDYWSSRCGTVATSDKEYYGKSASNIQYNISFVLSLLKNMHKKYNLHLCLANKYPPMLSDT